MQKVMTYAIARVFSSLLTGFMLRTSSGMEVLQVDVEEKGLGREGATLPQ
jgi:hypothetical protein